MHRFFIPPSCIKGTEATLAGDVAHQLARVLRARPGDRIILLDDSGWEYTVVLQYVSSHQARGTVESRLRSRGEPRVRVRLYAAVLKGDRFETVLQKGTELGVSVFSPVICARSVPRGRDWGAGRYQRWRRIVSEAAEQSHRGKTPLLEEPVDFVEACDSVEGPALVPWEEERECGLRQASGLLQPKSSQRPVVSIFTGPEGGLTPEEVEYARSHGIIPVSLGNRILRAETAAIATVAVLMYELGELG